MTTLKFAALPAIALFGMTLGCDTQSGSGEPKPSGGVAVVDLDKIGKELGKTDKIEEEMKTLTGNLDREFQQLLANAQKQLVDKEKELPAVEERSDEEKQEFARFGLNLQQQLNQARQRYQQQALQRRQQLVTELREEIKPVALEVAKSKGMTVLLTKLVNNSPLYHWDESADITDEVLAKLKGGGETAAPAEDSGSE